MTSRSIILAPIRFARYIGEPGRKAVAHREKLSPTEREQWRIDSL